MSSIALKYGGAAAVFLTMLPIAGALARSAPLIVEPLPRYTNASSTPVRGKAQPGARVVVRGGLRRVQGIAAADGSFALSVPLKTGQLNRLSVKVSGGEKDEDRDRDDDDDGDEGDKRVRLSITQDAVAPTLRAVLSAPANAAGWHRAAVTVHFVCEDAVSGIAQCPADVQVGTPGAHQVIQGEAIDRAGNRASASVEINLDTSAPVVSVDTPDPGKLVYQPTVHLHGSIADPLSGVAGVNCNNVAASLSAESFDCDVPLVQGANAIRVWAIDAAGNVGQMRQPLVFGPPLPGGDAHQVLIGTHLNGHRNLDTVRTDFDGRQVVIREGNGDGSFKAERHVAVGPYPSSVAVADVDGDGVPDILTTHYTTGEVAIQYGQQDGSFVAGPRIKVDAFPSVLLVADVNGDGQPDLIVASATEDTVRVYTWKAAGAFSAQEPMHVGHMPVALAIGSVASRLDILSANYGSDDVSLISSAGSAGQFAPERRLALAPASGQQTLAATRYGPSAVALGDVNGDKQQDIATANYLGGNVSVLTNGGKGKFSAQMLPAAGQPLGLALADLTGDGRADIALVDGSGQVQLLSNEGAVKGAVRFAPLTPIAAEAQSSALIAVDVNGDGKLDLLSSNARQQSVALSQGAGHFAQRFAVADAQANPYVMYLPLVAGADGLPGGARHGSAIEVHNVAPADSPITITFVREDNAVQWQISGLVHADASALLSDLSTMPAGWSGVLPPRNFRGAAIVSAQRPFHATSSLSTLAGSVDQYAALPARAGGRGIVFPRVVRNWEGANTRIGVQNVGDATAHVFVSFRPALPNSFDHGTRAGRIDLEPGQSQLILVENYPLLDGSGRFRGAATLSSDTDGIVAVALEENHGAGFEQVRLYQGVSEAQSESQLDVAPFLINADRGVALDRGSSWSSELEITNAGFERTDVTVTYGPNQLDNPGGGNLRPGAVPPPDTLPACGTLPPSVWTGLDIGQTFGIDPASTNNCRYVGSVHIASSTNQPLAVAALQKGGIDSAVQRAIGHNDVGPQLFLPHVRALDGAERASSEIAVTNAGDFGTSVTFTFAPNQIAGAGQPPDIVRFIDVGQTLVYGDLAQGIVQYVGSVKVSGDMNTAVTPGTLPQPARLAAVVTDVPALRTPGRDRLTAYVAQPLEHTKVMLRQAVLPVGLLATPCQAFINEVFLVRDGAPAQRRQIPGSTVHPVAVPPLVDVNCMQTEDEEINQRASAQGIILTRNLPTFLALDPVNGPLPVLLGNTNETFGDLTGAQPGTLMLGTTARTRMNVSVWNDAFLQLIGMTAATLAADALAKGASKAMQDSVSQFDWYNGPLAHTPNAPTWDQQKQKLISGLQGPGTVTAFTPEELQLFQNIREEIINAAPVAPPPPPDPNHCSNGFKFARTLGVEQDWYSLSLRLTRGSLSRLTFMIIKPKDQGFEALCEVLRRVAACARAQSLSQLLVQIPEGFGPDSGPARFLGSLFGATRPGDPGFNGWDVNLNDATSPGYRCLSYP